jgi:PAS domain S-box-containing protein
MKTARPSVFGWRIGGSGGCGGPELHRGTEMIAVFKRAFEEAPVGFVLFSPEFRLREPNLEFRRLVGYSREEVHSRTLLDLLHADDIVDEVRNAQKMFEKETLSYAYDARYVHRSGRVVSTKTTVLFFHDEELGATGLRWVEDVSESRKNEEILRQSQKMEAGLREGWLTT